MINYVAEFHEKFGLPDGSKDYLFDDVDAMIYRHNFLQEELDELEGAFEDEDRVKAFDALIDLVYVAYGTALFMGITPEMWHRGMKAVHEANMSKVRAQRAEQSKRGSTFDVIKPEGWESPEAKLREILSCRK